MIRADRRAIELAQLHRLELVSKLEATTLLLLIGVAVPLDHLRGWNAGVRIMGPVHGMTFLAFIWTALQTLAGDAADWSRSERVRLFVLAFIPFGGFFNLRLLSRKAEALRNPQAAA